MRTLIACTSLLVCLGCGASDLPDYVRLGGPRVLAMKADKPEVSPGDTVIITPV